jgi:hypothetical protein
MNGVKYLTVPARERSEDKAADRIEGGTLTRRQRSLRQAHLEFLIEAGENDTGVVGVHRKDLRRGSCFSQRIVESLRAIERKDRVPRAVQQENPGT